MVLQLFFNNCTSKSNADDYATLFAYVLVQVYEHCDFRNDQVFNSNFIV